MRARFLSVVCVVAAALLGACNEVGSCPGADTITPGGSCSGDNLQCAYTLQSASPACDGTTVEGGLATSCVCTDGAWVCPSAVVCPATGDDGGGEAGDDGGGEAGDDGGGEAGDDASSD
jgi:hypothetical protein